MGLAVGVFPGLGGIAGLSLLLPFMFGMEPLYGLALMVGMVAVVPTSDTFASVLMGIPGSSASQATVLDGFPLARKGQAARALSAAFTSSLFGGLGGLGAGRSPSKDKSLRSLAFEETKEAPPEAEAPPFPEVERPATAASAPSRPTTPAADEAADDDEGATVATADEEAPAEPAEEPTVEPPAEPAADEPTSGDASATAAAADEESPAGDGFAAPDVEE